jgi:hypothetical protein
MRRGMPRGGSGQFFWISLSIVIGRFENELYFDIDNISLATSFFNFIMLIFY